MLTKKWKIKKAHLQIQHQPQNIWRGCPRTLQQQSLSADTDLNSEKDSLLSSCIHPLPSREDLIQPQLGEMEGK